MVLIILSDLNLKTVIYTKIDLGTLLFSLKTKKQNKAKTLLTLSVLQKRNCDKFYDTDSKSIYSGIGMPLKFPHLQSKYKTQHHQCGAGIYTNLSSTPCTVYNLRHRAQRIARCLKTIDS